MGAEEKLVVLIQVLKELYIDDDNVPNDDNFRCTELDWFSQGIKDNVIRHIANRVFGIEEASGIFD